MSLEEKRKKRLYRNLFLLTLLLFIGSLLFSFYFITEQNKKILNASENVVSVMEFAKAEENISFLEAILEADEAWLLHGDPKSSQQKYQTLLPLTKDYTNILEARIARAQQVQGNSNDDELTKINLRTQLADAKERIQVFQDSLENIQDYSSTETRKITRKVDSLKEVITNKDKLLSRKESVKVISFKNENGNLIRYLGEIKNGKANGGGVGIWDTGSLYTGEWLDNRRNGKGEFKWADGEKYEGDFENGLRSGEGVFYYKSGERYEGEFKDNLRHGYGILYDKDGNVSYKGQWKKDKPVEL